MKLKFPSNKTLGWLAPLFLIISIMVMSSNSTPMWMDEYVFYRLSEQAPEYSSTADWILIDRPSLMNASVDWDREEMVKAMNHTYTTPMYTHIPLVPYIVSPIVKGLNKLADAGKIPHIEDEQGMLPIDPDDKNNYKVNLNKAEVITKVLRGITILLVTMSLVLIFLIVRKKVGNGAYFFCIPVAACVRLLTGAYFFYWDVFMMFFFILALYLAENRPNSKWKYVAACAMVNTKIFVSFLFLIPLIVKDRKMFWTAFSIIPFWVATWVVTGDIWYLFRHYFAGTYITDFVYSLYSFSDFILLLYSLGILLLFIMVFPILRYWKKYKVYVSILLVGFLYAFGCGLGMTHLSTCIYIGALIFPFVVYEFHLAEKLSKWISPKKAVINE